MYAGTTFRHKSGNIVGVHQRIDRVAKKQLIHQIGRGPFFPSIKTILHFEGKNGPDGIKSKSPSKDEPWHFISPNAGMGDPLVTIIHNHLVNLSNALKAKDEVRAGFEAAWLAHAITDGLTPAHHYPLAEKVEELWGKSHTERLTTRDKIMIKGNGGRDTLSKNWQYWGLKGVFTTHFMYEWGIATSIATTQFNDVGIRDEDLKRVEKEGYLPFFMESLKTVDSLHTYEDFTKNGWTTQLGNVSRKQLVPLIIKNVSLAWYAAYKGKV